MRPTIYFAVAYILFIGLVLTGNAEELRHRKVELNFLSAYEPAIEPQQEEPFFTRVYANAVYVPVTKPAVSTDEHVLVVHGVSTLSFEEWKKWETASLTEPSTFVPVCEEINFSSRKAARAYKKALAVKKTTDFAVLCEAVKEPLSFATIMELSAHTK